MDLDFNGFGFSEKHISDNWAAEYLARNLNLHKELDILDHPDGSVTKAKLSSALQRDIDNTADTADTALDLAGDNEAAIKELKSRLTSDEQSAADEHSRILGKIGNLQSLSTAEKNDIVSAINEVYSNTDNAQTAADNAQTAADNAQTAADNAQTAADNAQTAVNELESDIVDINRQIDDIHTVVVADLMDNINANADNTNKLQQQLNTTKTLDILNNTAVSCDVSITTSSELLISHWFAGKTSLMLCKMTIPIEATSDMNWVSDVLIPDPETSTFVYKSIKVYDYFTRKEITTKPIGNSDVLFLYDNKKAEIYIINPLGDSDTSIFDEAPLSVTDLINPVADRVTTLETQVGDIDTALDNIIAIQNSLISGGLNGGVDISPILP